MQRIIWFTYEKGCCYLKKSWRRCREEKTGFPKVRTIDLEGIQIVICIFPEYYKSRKSTFISWNVGTLTKLMQNSCIEFGADTYYLHEDFRQRALLNQIFHIVAKQRMSLEVWRVLLGKMKAVDVVIYLPNRNQSSLPPRSVYDNQALTPEWLSTTFLRKIRFFFLLEQSVQVQGDETESISETGLQMLEDFLWQQYGMPVIRIPNLFEVPRICENSGLEQIALIDDRDEEVGVPNLAQLGDGKWKAVLYIDLWSVNERCQEAWAYGNREKWRVKYLSEYQYVRRLAESHK